MKQTDALDPSIPAPGSDGAVQTLPPQPPTRLRDQPWQYLAIAFCLALGVAMILNTQMAGEGVWFWYTNAFRHGAKLYADLHLALQPLYILQTAAWMKLFGMTCFATETPSVVRVLIFSTILLLILRQSDWPDWQKAIILAGTFVLCLQVPSYRFDDYHIVADIFIFGSLAVLLALPDAHTIQRQSALVVLLGMLSGLTVTTRLNDGAALLAASGICLLFFVRSRKLLFVGAFALAAVITVLLVVACTGDSFSSYVSNSVIKAAGSKGGTSSIFAAPFLLFRNTLTVLRHGGKSLLLLIFAMGASGAVLQRWWRDSLKYLVPLQLVLASAAFSCSSHTARTQILTGTLIEFVVLFAIAAIYLLAPIVLMRYLIWMKQKHNIQWNPREILILLPLAALASTSASTAGQPRQGFYPQIAMLLLLFVLIRPFRNGASWLNSSFLSLIALLTFTGVTAKIHNPYSWQDYKTAPMFVNRVWYRHPQFGLLYIDRDQLALNEAICSDINQSPSATELLSLPYPYPNYFCAIPPWHGYVQTFFDTSTRATINHLIAELNTAPPQWIVYQRQMYILGGAERLYNHGEPLAQRDLDALIMRNIATGQWQLVDKRAYTALLEKSEYLPGDGWYVIRTTP